jgi:mannose-6-phosphate isomerase-like protein (cupin superfamily)
MQQDYRMNLDVKYDHLTVVDVGVDAAAVADDWYHQTLMRVNESIVRMGVVRGEFHWHHHDKEDEFFIVLSGELFIDVEGRDTVRLTQHQSFAVTHGIEHRTRAPEGAVILMVSPKDIVPTGD